MNPEKILELFEQTEVVVRARLKNVTNWGMLDTSEQTHSGQHHPDVAADEAAREILSAPEFDGEKNPCVTIMSEESGWVFPNGGPNFLKENPTPKNIPPNWVFDYTQLTGNEVVVVIDPIDGSTNASKRIPWFALSLCALDKDGMLVSYVSNIAINESDEHPKDTHAYTAIRNQGAKQGSQVLKPTDITDIKKTVAAFCNYSTADTPAWLKEATQLRAFGAAALEICLVAAGGLDIYVDCTEGIHYPWDYLGAALICQEAGAIIKDVQDRNLLELSMQTKRQPIAVATIDLLVGANL